MIQITRQSSAPARLRNAGKRLAQRDRAAYIANRSEYRSGYYKFTYDRKVYAAKRVKNDLVEIHHCKCCYCEKKFPPVKLDIEHFRPKGAVKQSIEDDQEWPGYYWLVYSWDNLLLSCGDCNRIHKKELFPLANPPDRARSHEDCCRIEQALLVDPVKQDPRTHIKFDGPAPTGDTAEGEETIKVVGLRRWQLYEYRQFRLIELDELVARLVGAAEKPDDAQLQADADQARCCIESAKSPGGEFSSMAIDYLAQFGL